MAAWCRSVYPAVCSFSRLIAESISTQEARGFHSSRIVNGGRPKSFWRRKRHPANTRLNHELPEKIKERKAYGGHNKMKALRIQNGNFTLKSCDANIQSPIASVLYSYANSSHVDSHVIVKGSIVQLDVSPFKAWYDSEVNTTQEDKDTKELRTSHISEETKKMIESGLLFAKVETRPGQVGVCNGYILEGQELEALKNNLNLDQNH